MKTKTDKALRENFDEISSSSTPPHLVSEVNRSQRPRRLRQSQLIRDLVAETDLTSSRMIQPHFVCDGVNIKEEIAGLPGIYRESVDEALKSVTADRGLGVNKIMLFGVTDHKSEDASYSHSPDNPVMRACRELKERFGKDLFVSADVCLCAYTKSGHCGIVRDGEVDNDSSVEILVEMALALAATGCDCVAPSDMMDGRIGGIRSALEREGLARTIIMAYTAKYSSAYYGPFREAAKSAPASETAGVPDDRKTYQMDSRNQTEALRELELDIAEGADIVMVKPALAYLDVIAKFKERSTAPVAAYNVSGEYAAVKLMAREGLADERELALENLTAIRRAGASVILTYHLRDILKHEWLER